MKILCITHADFESPGVIESWASEREYLFKIKRPYKGEALSNIETYDLLILMGGPQSPTKLEKFPYLADEIQYIRSAIAKNKKVIGFCLGAQLIGEALGAKTLKSPEKEIGVFPISLTLEAHADPLLSNVPQYFKAIHWHNDMPGLTPDAVLLAVSEGCPHQIVRYQKNIYAFQCHLEITLEGIGALIHAVPEDLKPSKYTQTTAELLDQDYASINQLMITILDRFIEL